MRSNSTLTGVGQMATGTLRGVGNIVGVKPNKRKKKVKGVVGGLSSGVDDVTKGI